MVLRIVGGLICLGLVCVLVAAGGAKDSSMVIIHTDANNDGMTGDPLNLGTEAYALADPNQAVYTDVAWHGRSGFAVSVSQDAAGGNTFSASLTNGSFGPCSWGDAYVFQSPAPRITDSTQILTGIDGPQVDCSVHNGSLVCGCPGGFNLEEDWFYIPGCSDNPDYPTSMTAIPFTVDPGLETTDSVLVTATVGSGGVSYTSSPVTLAQFTTQHVGCVKDHTNEVLDPNGVTFPGGSLETTASMQLLDRHYIDTSDPSSAPCADGPPDSVSLFGTFALKVTRPPLQVTLMGNNQPAIAEVTWGESQLVRDPAAGGWVVITDPCELEFDITVTGTDVIEPGTFAIATQYPPLDPNEVSGRRRKAEVVIEDSPLHLGYAGRWALAGGPDPCVTSEENHCINLFRFETAATWRDHHGDTGAAKVVPWTSEDSGLYWFFNESNVEMVMKVLDGCWLNDHYWVFAAGLTDVETDLTITDTLTGTQRTYTNSLGVPFAPILDTTAFATCDGGLKSGVEPVRSVEARAKALSQQLDTLLGSLGEESGETKTTGTCSADAQTLCLRDDRFAVTSTWATAGGGSGVGQARSITADTGYFWFFDQNNIEVLLKVLRGCGINQRFWVFSGGLTNVEVNVRVEDTVTGEVKEYLNPMGVDFQPITDTDAFATCP